MPSDERIVQALEALVDAKESFTSSVAMSAEEVRGILERGQGGDEDPQARLAHELGPFAAGRIDLDRLAPFVGANKKLDPDKRAEILAAYQTLTELKKAGDDLFTAKVPLDGYLRGAVFTALGKAGSAFGAARSVEWALHDLAHPEGVEDCLERFPPNKWNSAERVWAPPLVIEVEGQDLRPASLAELLEGGQKIVLVVNGPAAPAPLVRLITPGVAVIQTDDPAELSVLGAVDGPGIAAVMPEGCAKFMHIPGEGRSLDQRLTVSHLPEKAPKRALGSISAFHQAEELGQLASLTASVGAVETASVDAGLGVPEMDDAGQLASWLIHQSGV
ncbi:MAG: hypothetical protein HKO65_13850 [Gemmatimonadetes bacterium]|nr:hypothetical protein [Gemmatimonadota bacterium]NNM06168.1 hypothetical protein [Gemmatimonadota bacterium]